MGTGKPNLNSFFKELGARMKYLRRFLTWHPLAILALGWRQTLLALAIVLGAAPAVHAGAFDVIAIGYWKDIIASYWWQSRKDYLQALFTDGPPALLPGERAPLGLRAMYLSDFAPADPAHVTCGDFRVLRLDRPDPLGEIEFPSRRRADKSAVYFTGGGWLYGIGRPSWMHFWVAVMLPDGAEPLFNPDGMGLNPKVLARPAIAELGSVGHETMPPEKMRLNGITHCNGFDIYDVEFRR